MSEREEWAGETLSNPIICNIAFTVDFKRIITYFNIFLTMVWLTVQIELWISLVMGKNCIYIFLTWYKNWSKCGEPAAKLGCHLNSWGRKFLENIGFYGPVLSKSTVLYSKLHFCLMCHNNQQNILPHGRPFLEGHCTWATFSPRASTRSAAIETIRRQSWPVLGFLLKA